MDTHAETAPFSAERIRGDFPMFTRQVRGKPLTFLDSAASSQKPTSVLETMDWVYRWCYANVHRGIYCLSEEATCCYEDTRDKAGASQQHRPLVAPGRGKGRGADRAHHYGRRVA